MSDQRVTTPTLVVLACVTAVGMLVRAIPILLSDFPVNDGGLFYAMVRAIQAAGWMVPSTVAWNGNELPFTYPPLAFYVVGGLESIFGADLPGVFRWLPLAASTLIIPAVFLLARALLRSDLGAGVAAATYALAPSSYVWLVQGGGITRAPGMLLAVLTLWQVVALVRGPSRRGVLLVGVLAGLTALTHPGAAIFAALSAGLIWAFEGRSRPSLAHAAAAVGVGLVVAAPWLVIIAARGDLATLIGVPSNGPDPRAVFRALVAGGLTGAPFTDPLSIVGLTIAFLCLVRRRFLLPAWFGVALVLSYQYAMIPFSLLVAVPAMDLAALRTAARAHPVVSPTRWVPVVGLILLAFLLTVEAGVSAVAVLNPGAPLHALSAERRAAMAWVAANLEPDARVAVITDSTWSGDPDSEWFPVLANRPSVATVQGAEWLGEAALAEQARAHRALQGCVRPASPACVRDWLAQWPADYVYIPKGQLHGRNSPEDCCADLRAALLSDPAFTPIYAGLGATILRVNRQASADQGS